MRVRATVLGTGDAWPIPRPGCACPQCAEARADSRRSRTRSALLLETEGECLLVDANPDVARQLERRGAPPRVDRVLVSHTHVDHVIGLDDLVSLRVPSPEPLPVHAAPFHAERIRATFPHLVREGRERIRLLDGSPGTRLALPGALVEAFETGHRAEFPTSGAWIRIDTPGGPRSIAYATDLGPHFPEPARRLVAGADLLVADGTYLGAPGHGHPGTDAVVALARELGVRRLALTHVGHWGVEAREAARRLPPDVVVLSDGDDLGRLVH